MRRVMPIYFAATLALLLFQADAKVASFDLCDMIREADTIVIGTVEKVSSEEGQAPASTERKRYRKPVLIAPDELKPCTATVKVITVLKGDPGKEVKVDVTKAWPCDISEAKQGEKILLFTLRDKESGENVIYASGRGRIPIDTVGGADYATFWSEVIMPECIRTAHGPDPQCSFIRRANLADLLDYVKKVLGENPRERLEGDRK